MTVDLKPRESTASVLETIAAGVGSVPRILLRDTDAGFEPPLIKPGNEAGAGAPIRYRIDGEIARGGMGSVLKGRDPDLGRDVAVKVLREDLRDNPEMVRRFVEEAQIGGQLQHPGVVPIYELGTFADRRPFFSMKLVKGHTLAGLLESRKQPGDDLPRFIGIFEQVAQTVAYAHARGVIHRDLKPSNVMVGAFGEVQVMDWGLAKVLPRGGKADDAQAGKTRCAQTVIATARSGSDDPNLSQAGSAMGTPSYMAPEQARGELDAIDERADVFALGSILCEILTSEPVFIGRSSGEIQRKAAVADTADAVARLAACGADSELISLAKECLAREPEDRPRDASAVAESISAYVSGVQEKLRRAELARVEERGRRRLTTVAAAAVIVLGLVAGGSTIWVQQQKAQRLAKTARGVDDALDEAARLRGEAQSAPPEDDARWGEAVAAAKQAQALATQGEPDKALRARVSALLAQLDRERAAAHEKAGRLAAERALLAELQLIRDSRGDHGEAKRTDAEYAAALRKAGIDVDASGPEQAARWIATRSDPIELAGYLDDWAYLRQQIKGSNADWRPIVALARSADPDPWRDALRKKTASNDEAANAEFRRLADDAVALDAQPATSLVLLARQLKYGPGDRERAERVLRRAVSRFPGDFWAHVELARAPGVEFWTTRELYPRSEDAVRYLTAALAIRPASATTHSKLGLALLAHGKRGEAISEFRVAIRLMPAFAGAHGNLGMALCQAGELEKGIAEHRAAIRLMPESAMIYNNLGLALRAQEKLGEAVTAYRTAIRLMPDYVLAHSNLGKVLVEAGKLEEGIVECRTAIRLKPDFITAHEHLITAFGLLGKLSELVTEYSAADRLSSPTNLYALGSTLEVQGKLEQAIVRYREALSLKPDFAVARFGVGSVLQLQGKLAEAAAAYREALQLDPRLGLTYARLGQCEEYQGNLDQALAAYRRGQELSEYGKPVTPALPEMIRSVDRQIALAARLAGVLRGEDKPSGAGETLAFARLCVGRKLYVAAARFFTEAFAADPKLVRDRDTNDRYDAACSAALAGCGKCKDNPAPDEAARTRLRRQALDWLRAELEAWNRHVATEGSRVSENFQFYVGQYRSDGDLAGVRDPEALAKLPEEEQKAWRAFWAEVDSALKTVPEKPK